MFGVFMKLKKREEGRWILREGQKNEDFILKSI